METTDASHAALRDRYLAALLAGDREAALHTLDEGAVRGVSPPDLAIDVVGGAQREIGRLWSENRIGIAEEHLATAISQVGLARLYGRGSAPRNGRRVLVACVEGELHDMGARIAGDVLDAAGFGVRMLGASVPTASLVAMVEQACPDLVALSATMTFNLPALREAAARVRALPAAPPVIVNASPGDGAALPDGVVVVGGSARELVAAARRLLGVAPVGGFVEAA